MRGMIEGLETPHPIGFELPGLFHDDDFTQRFTAALDEVIAPIFLTLDALEAYVDPWLAPEDFLGWLKQKRPRLYRRLAERYVPAALRADEAAS